MPLVEAPLTFFTHPQSRGRIVRWMLEEIDCPYETKILDFKTTMKSPDYLAVNPMGKVPALKHGDAVVTETIAICTYLADVFPEAHLAPDASDILARADYFRWLFFVAGPLEGAVTDKLLNVTVPMDKKLAIGHRSLDEICAILRTLLKGKDFIADNRFSTVDLIMSSYISLYTMLGALESEPELKRYANLHKNRPAALRALEIDENLSKAA